MNATEQSMGQRRTQKRNLKILQDKWKYNILKFMGCSKSSYKREVHSKKCLHQETRKISNTDLISQLKELEKEEKMKPKVSRRKEGNNKGQSGSK